ncbi:MAG: hypothetical protein LBM94_02990 [Propionibacteriaceae bacterium]|nr:hypothetical protein [Propionibacteriaceae bacterium]
MPLTFDNDVVPLTGQHPQAIINDQILKNADIVIAILWSRLGTPTPNASSGTVEEIATATYSGKPVHLFFCSASPPASVDPEQLAALHEYESDMQSTSLYGRFATPADLAAKIPSLIEYDLSKISGAALDIEVRLLPQWRTHNMSDGSSRTTWHEGAGIEVFNPNSDVAESVEVEVVAPEELRWSTDIPITVDGFGLTTLETPLQVSDGVVLRLRVSWRIAGEHKVRKFVVK